MNFRDALVVIANHTRFAEESLKLEVIAAIDDALVIPEPLDIVDGEIVADDQS